MIALVLACASIVAMLAAACAALVAGLRSPAFAALGLLGFLLWLTAAVLVRVWALVPVAVTGATATALLLRRHFPGRPGGSSAQDLGWPEVMTILGPHRARDLTTRKDQR